MGFIDKRHRNVVYALRDVTFVFFLVFRAVFATAAGENDGTQLPEDIRRTFCIRRVTHLSVLSRALPILTPL